MLACKACGIRKLPKHLIDFASHGCVLQPKKRPKKSPAVERHQLKKTVQPYAVTRERIETAIQSVYGIGAATFQVVCSEEALHTQAKDPQKVAAAQLGWKRRTRPPHLQPPRDAEASTPHRRSPRGVSAALGAPNPNVGGGGGGASDRLPEAFLPPKKCYSLRVALEEPEEEKKKKKKKKKKQQ